MTDSQIPFPSLECPIPIDGNSERITLAHGEGGRLSRNLIRDRILRRFSHHVDTPPGDAAHLQPGNGAIAFTSDGYTVTPLFFPGGDIGKLSVYGTANDLAVSGAVPRWLSLSLIIEEGLPWAILDRVLDSIQAAASQAEVSIVTGDTKVVPRGTADKLFITTSGIGDVLVPTSGGPGTLQCEDVLIVSGPLGQHGAAIFCAREELDFDPLPVSDCNLLMPPLAELHQRGLFPRVVRDATRGGVAAVLHEWAAASRLSCVIDEQQIPIGPAVRTVCEILGLDPLHLANEGTFVLATPAALVESTLAVLRNFEVSLEAAVIGRVEQSRSSPVVVRRGIGQYVPLDEPSGSPLPRIC